MEKSKKAIKMSNKTNNFIIFFLKHNILLKLRNNINLCNKSCLNSYKIDKISK